MFKCTFVINNEHYNKRNNVINLDINNVIKYYCYEENFCLLLCVVSFTAVMAQSKNQQEEKPTLEQRVDSL